MSFTRYPSYKDSGVEWLGEVPLHWSVISIKWLSPVQRGASPRPIDDPIYFEEGGEYAWVRIADVSASDGVLKETTQRLSALGSSLSVKLEPGELFVSIAGTVGKPCIAAIKACIHDGFVYFPSLAIDPRFLYRIFECGACYAGLGEMGTQLNMNTDTIGSIRVALPPEAELRQVLSFLEKESAKLDALMAEQRTLIDLLKEKRQAVISHAVTKGLNPDAPIKDSGVEWLGGVPQHWIRTPIKYVIHEIIDTEHKTAQFSDDGAYLVIRTSNIKDGKLVLDDAKYTDIEGYLEWTKRGKPIAGDIIFTREAPAGEACIVPESVEMCLGQRTVLLRVNHALLDSRYGLWSIYGGLSAEFIALLVQGSTVAHFNMSEIGDIPLMLPPREEQSQIVGFLNDVTAKLDALTAEANQAITLLQERRTALISAAVTGKIDVRGLAQ